MGKLTKQMRGWIFAFWWSETIARIRYEWLGPVAGFIGSILFGAVLGFCIAFVLYPHAIMELFK